MPPRHNLGEFIFEQFPRKTRQDLGELVKELRNRFFKVETVRIFWTQFSNCDQKAGETTEEFAIGLKHLYEKAH